jgi:phosphoribosylamine--glycine ligase
MSNHETLRVLVVGSGGREQAIAWACRRHGHTATVAPRLIEGNWDVCIPGPETVLADGIADECAARGIPCFGPTTQQAMLESSKAWARRLADLLAIPGPRWRAFEDGDIDAALAWWRSLDPPSAVVVKLDGLQAGKGVVVPDSDAATEAAIRATSGPFQIEERLHGPEYSLIALCSGRTAMALPLAQDHKRIGAGDVGPNTGGMGAFAPAPGANADELCAMFVQPVLEHFADQGTPYVGVIFAGLMLTADGPRLIEYNARFGDPETQALLPLVDSDLAVLAVAATRGRLHEHTLELRAGASCTVVAAAEGYPAAPRLGARLHVPPALPVDALLFPAGVGDAPGGRTIDPSSSFDDEPPSLRGSLRVTGGRVLAITGLGKDLAAARATAYEAMSGVRFDGMQVRPDIGWRAPGASIGSYASTSTRAVAQSSR